MTTPQNLMNKIKEYTKQLESLQCINEFRFKIIDMDPAIVTAADFDDSSWESFSGKPTFKRDQGVTWIRATYTVPLYCLDIPIAGSELRVATGTPEEFNVLFCPIQIYSDSKLLLAETSWMDCKCPEGIVSTNAKPNTTHTIALRIEYLDKSFWEPNVHLSIISDAVEDAIRQMKSIISELIYIEDIEGSAELLPRCYEMLQDAVNSEKILNIVKAASCCREILEPLRSEVKKHTVHLVAHAHIDMNWFWSMEETERIIDRDFTTMTTLMDENSDFVFSQSQCATYAIEERNNPEIFKKMQKYAENGQWDVTASSWVEGDLNMASGESIARHSLYSKKYLKEKFNCDPRIMWCPDTFGHPANIPQMLKKSGIDYYFHMRCGIGVDHTPHKDFTYLQETAHTPIYWWCGQDGSRVLSGNNIYNNTLSTQGILSMAKAIQTRFNYNKSMFVYGTGDHGGGATRRDLSWMREICNYPTIPTIKFSSTHDFYKQVEMDNPSGIPTRVGEMNCVFDGCYTTHGDVKYYNRKSENDLEATEQLCALAARYGYEYPTAEFEELWRVALFNQFHDIFDGSGVKDTYDFTSQMAEKLLARLKEIAKDATKFISDRIAINHDLGSPIVVFNTTFAARDECVLSDIPGDVCAVDSSGNALATQKSDNGSLVFVKDIPAFGYRVVYLNNSGYSDYKSISLCDNYYNISTNYYNIEIHKSSGRITTLFNKQTNLFVVRREEIGFRLKNGCLNTLQIQYEEPTEMSSWTIGSIGRSLNLISGATSSIVEDGAVRKVIRFEHSFDSSTISQDIVVYNDSPRIDFVTNVNWNEYGDFDREAPMLKASFSSAVANTHAVYEIPFGVIERPTGDYEYPSLRFVDITDGKNGFALLNDSKHGYMCKGNELSITLIRSGWLPDQKSDIGKHTFTYSILPHTGDYLEGEVLKHAAFVNNPLRVSSSDIGGELSAEMSLLSSGNPSIPLCGVKCSENTGDLVFKLYNCSCEVANTAIKCGLDVDTVYECDFLEQHIDNISINNSLFNVTLKPHEIKSYIIKLN